MDFEVLFWIALIIFYFATRVLGGKSRQRPTPEPTGRRRPDRSTSAQDRPESRDELDEALREIRGALGFPVEEPAPHPSPAEKAAERARAEREARTKEEDRRAAKLDETRMKDAREAARQRELQERAERTGRRPDTRLSGLPTRTGLSRPQMRGPHEVESSFREEDMFERAGRHPHAQPRRVLQVISPYEAPRRKHLPGLMRRLHNRSSLREAFLTKEILEKPLALRRRR